MKNTPHFFEKVFPKQKQGKHDKNDYNNIKNNLELTLFQLEANFCVNVHLSQKQLYNV